MSLKKIIDVLDDYVDKTDDALFESLKDKKLGNFLALIYGSLNILRRGLGNSFKVDKFIFNPIRIKDIEKNLVNLQITS